MRTTYGSLALVFLSASCIHHGFNRFVVIPAAPEYQLQTPDRKEEPFSQILGNYNGYQPGLDWIDIKPGMQLHIEDAFYKKGMPRSGLTGFLGTETAQYALNTRQAGLHLLSVHSMPERPPEQRPVEQLISPGQERHQYFRFYNEVFFRTEQGRSKGSVLLGAETEADLTRLVSEMQVDPARVCSQTRDTCSVFPEACSVAVEMEITVNNKQQVVPWTSSLGTITPAPRDFKLFRPFHGHLIPVTMPKHDDTVLRIPLLPGDHITWH